jgi:hypothetical protein
MAAKTLCNAFFSIVDKIYNVMVTIRGASKLLNHARPLSQLKLFVCANGETITLMLT